MRTDETERRTTLLDSKTLIGRLNWMMIGWANYSLETPSGLRIEAQAR